MIRGGEELRALAAAPPALRPGVRRFYFLRHGETAGNAGFIVQSPVIPLNEAGRAQAERAADRLADATDITRIEASSYPRAYETAQAAARRLAVPMNATPRLGERLFGELVGQTALALDWRARPAGGETLEAFVARTKSAAADALRDGGIPCIVAHGGNLRVIAAALGIGFRDEFAPNALPLRFDRSDAGWAVTVL